MPRNIGQPKYKMSQEIEHKFLVKGDFRPFVTKTHHIVQGYICSGQGRIVRVRLCDEQAFLTIKGPTEADGLSRFEWEKQIGHDEALELFKLCGTGLIEKYRHLVPVGAHIFEVDEFLGANSGLIVAEVELGSIDEPFEKPDWLGKDVSVDPRYRNSQLCIKPYVKWNENL